jgi:hypothetical protein
MSEPIRCFLVEPDPDGGYRRADDHSQIRGTQSEFGAGACWKDGELVKVILPKTGLFCPQRKSADGQPWECTGEVPNITVKPSVDDPGVWHGWITDGVITEC